MSSITKTTYYPQIFDEKVADGAYEYLEKNIDWRDSIFSKRKNKVTRKGYSSQGINEIDEYIDQLVEIGLSKIEQKYVALGIYVNYYRDGIRDFCPNHTHPGTVQMVISLGATRTLQVGKRDYPMKSGDMIVFGASSHGVPEEPDVKSGRISIAVFLKKKPDDVVV